MLWWVEKIYKGKKYGKRKNDQSRGSQILGLTIRHMKGLLKYNIDDSSKS